MISCPTLPTRHSDDSCNTMNHYHVDVRDTRVRRFR